jgi:response regulator RpfG family c-di-GMP phosphodiesterase
MVNGVPTQHVDTIEFVEVADAAAKRAQTAVVKSLGAMAHNETQLAARVAMAVDDPTRKTSEGQLLAREIRAHVKSLSEKNRFQFVAQKIEQGNLKAVAAVIQAPAFLSGLEDSAGATLKTLAEMKFAPIERSQLEATRKALKHVEDASKELADRMYDLKVIGSNPIPATN